MFRVLLAPNNQTVALNDIINSFSGYKKRYGSVENFPLTILLTLINHIKHTYPSLPPNQSLSEAQAKLTAFQKCTIIEFFANSNNYSNEIKIKIFKNQKNQQELQDVLGKDRDPVAIYVLKTMGKVLISVMTLFTAPMIFGLFNTEGERMLQHARANMERQLAKKEAVEGEVTDWSENAVQVQGRRR